MRRLLTACLILSASGIPGVVWAQSSPFMRNAATPAASASATAEESGFQFSGVVAMGKDTLVCITEESTKRSHWIKVGRTVEGIHVAGYDAASQQVVIRRAGRESALQLKAPVVDPSQLVSFQSTGNAGPVPVAEMNIPVAVTKEEKETEARMLVSDLLEIGMIQRKAYEEARKADVEAQRKELAKAPE